MLNLLISTNWKSLFHWFLLFQLLEVPLLLGVGEEKVVALIQKTKPIKKQKLNKLKKLTPKLEEQVKQPEFLIEYFSGIEKGDFYEEPIEGEYPDW